MTAIEKVNQMLDFTTHIKKVQSNINTCKECNNKEDADYWGDVLKELIKVRQTVEVKMYKAGKAGNGA